MILEKMKMKIDSYFATQRRDARKIAFYVFMALTIRWGLAEAYRIPSESMSPTLKIGDHIMVNKAQYGVRIPFTKKTVLKTGTYQRGDVVVFRYPHDESIFYVKRIVGLPGDHVYVDSEGQLFIDGKKQKEEFTGKLNLSPSLLSPFGPVIVPENKLFVLGDNRNNSSDSRVWGFLPKENIMGKVAFKWFSWVD